MEEYATSDDLQDRLTLDKIKKIIEAKDTAKRSMTKLNRAQEGLHGSGDRVSDSREKQKCRKSARRGRVTTERGGTQHDTGPTCTF